MFIGNLFYKTKTGEIKELTVDFLYEKINKYFEEDKIEDTDIENLLSVLSFYVKSSKKDNLIEEEEIDSLLQKVKESKYNQKLFIEDNEVTLELFKSFLKEIKVSIPKNLEKQIYEEVLSALKALSSSINVNNFKVNSFEYLIYEILDKYEIRYKKKKKLVFPIDELLLIYSKYSPFETGKYFNEVVNYYLFNNFLYNKDLKELENKNIFTKKELSPFQVDMLDLVLDNYSYNENEFELAKKLILYKKDLYEKIDVNNKLLFQMNKNEVDYNSIIYLDKFIEYNDNIHSFTFIKNENYSLFSLDETIFPVYPSFFNIELNIDKITKLDSMNQLDLLEKLVKYLNAFYYKYNEYFYLIDLLKKRNLYIKIYIDTTSENYNHLLTSYLDKIIDNDSILIVLVNKNGNINKKKLKEYVNNDYLVNLTIFPDDWDENLFKFCKKYNIYQVSFIN